MNAVSLSDMFWIAIVSMNVIIEIKVTVVITAVLLAFLSVITEWVSDFSFF